MKDGEVLHLILESLPTRRRVGHVLLRNSVGRVGNLEFKRIVVESKGHGFGREAVRLMKELAFERLGVHRLYLDVKDFNRRARRLYVSEGFVVEGNLRECIKGKDKYHSLILMSLLRREYRRTSQS